MAKSIVIDANATLGLFLRLPYSKMVDQWMLNWQTEKTHLVVPTLWEAEFWTVDEKLFNSLKGLGVVWAKSAPAQK